MLVENATEVKELLAFREKLIEMQDKMSREVSDRFCDDANPYEVAKFMNEELKPVIVNKIDSINKKLAKM